MDGGRIDDDDFELAFVTRGSFRSLKVQETLDEYSVRLASNPAAAADKLRNEAVNGCPRAQVGWGHMLISGHGVPRDNEAALRWFSIAARLGGAEALNMVGRCHELGWGTPISCSEAAVWYRRAAAQGDAWAQFNLASLVAQGRGVAADISGALTLLVKSARQGNAKAMNMLGRFREDGIISAPKPRSAVEWYRRAAKRNCFRGQFHLGMALVSEGKAAEARHWFQASLRQSPPNFRREALDVLRRHPEPDVRHLVRRIEFADGTAPA